MTKSKYQINEIDSADRWIFIRYDEWDFEEPDSFIELVRFIRHELEDAMAIEVGTDRYIIQNDPMKLIYQWDSLYGITVEYPEEANVNDVLSHINTMLTKLNGDIRKS